MRVWEENFACEEKKGWLLTEKPEPVRNGTEACAERGLRRGSWKADGRHKKVGTGGRGSIQCPRDIPLS